MTPRSRISWPDLLAIYSASRFNADGSGDLLISDANLLETLNLIEGNDDNAKDANLVVLNEDQPLIVGKRVRIEFHAPRMALGRFVASLGDLLKGPEARVKEPEHYFVIEGKLTAATVSDLQLRYRQVIRLIDILKQAAAYLDEIQQELVFIRDGRIVIPVDYDTHDLQNLNSADVERLLNVLKDELHLSQKLTILGEAVIDAVAGVPAAARFRSLLRAIPDLAARVREGYRLFISSFSYAKIRREVESAQAEFLARIHKTFVDLQGQLLGIPIATIVVASQLKVVKECGPDFWTNLAIVAGAWIFVVFLLASIVNQWLTLNAISAEFSRQRERLLSDFSEVKSKFDDVYASLARRSFWHRLIFVVVGAIGIGGAAFATWVALRLAAMPLETCV